MIKKIFSLILAIMFLSLCSNPTMAKRIKKVSQLEMRDMETRFFETPDTDIVMKAAVNTLQDSGFVIQEIEPDLGYLRAQKTFKGRFVNKGRVAGWSLMLALMTTYTVFSCGTAIGTMYDPAMRVSNELRDKTIIVDSNVNIEKFGKDQTKVRFVLVEKILQNADGYSFVKSAPMRIIRIYTPEVYQEFFAQMDKSIFYEKI